MNIALDKNIMLVRLYAGEDFFSSMEKAFEDFSKLCAVISSCAGMLKNIRIGFFKGEGKYYEKELADPHEIVSMTGNFIKSTDGFFPHIHVALADETFSVRGGHLLSAEVYGTNEISLDLTEIEATRRLEESTGLKGLKI